MLRLLATALCVGLVTAPSASARPGARDTGFGGGDGLVTDQVRRGGFSVADALVRADATVHVLALPDGVTEIATYDARGRRTRVRTLPVPGFDGSLVEAAGAVVVGTRSNTGLHMARLDREGRPVGRTRRIEGGVAVLAGLDSGAVIVARKPRRDFSWFLDRFDRRGRRVGSWTAPRVAEDSSVAAIPGSGSVVVASPGNGRVRMFDARGRTRWDTVLPGALRDGQEIIVSPDRRGRVTLLASGLADDPRMIRLLPDGRIDRSWGPRGGLALSSWFEPAGRIRRDAAGRLVISGLDGRDNRGAVVRVTARGRLDRGFGNAGAALAPGTIEDASIVHDARTIGRRVLAAGYRLTGGGFREDFGDPGTVMLLRLLR